MKHLSLNIIVIIVLFFTVFSCQEVIDVDLETSQERLVIEALLKWDNGTSGNNQTIKLSKTSSFYNNQFVPAIGASIVLSDTSSLIDFVFTDNNDGTYSITNFVPILNNTYKLKINYNNNQYVSESTLLQAPTILDITQSTESGFSTEDPEVTVRFQDFVDQEDFYRIVFKQHRPSTNNELIEQETWTYDGNWEANNILEEWYESEDLISGDEIYIQIYKISSEFYTFLEVLEQQSNAGIGPFASPPVNVKGNIINTTNSENYPYGYFSLNEINSNSYTFE